MSNSFEAAKKIVHLSDDSVTNLQLQKILYLAHMVHLVKCKEPLVSESFRAWTYGPVLPKVYHHLKIFGSKPVKDIFYETDLINNTPESDTLEKAWNALSTKEGWELVGMTHRAQGAWAKNFNSSGNRVIPNEDIVEEYKTLYGI